MSMNPCTVEMKVATAVNVSSNAQNRLWNILKSYVTVTEADNTSKYLPTFVSKQFSLQQQLNLYNWMSKVQNKFLFVFRFILTDNVGAPIWLNKK